MEIEMENTLTIEGIIGISNNERFVILQQARSNVCLPLDVELVVFPQCNDQGELDTVTVDVTFR